MRSARHVGGRELVPDITAVATEAPKLDAVAHRRAALAEDEEQLVLAPEPGSHPRPIFNPDRHVEATLVDRL